MHAPTLKSTMPLHPATQEMIERVEELSGKPVHVGALQRFEGMPLAEIQKISFEIAMLGTRGLDVNDPAEQYTLRSIPGKFSGLHLLCIEYVGFQKIDPKLDLGFDLSAEYEAARAMFGK
jgi:hypothetical protein